jgi:chromosome segregation ATPase
MEGCFEKIISNVDVFRMLRLSVTDVLTLRLVSKRLNTAVTERDRFWQNAFPSLENKNEVVDLCRKRYLVRKLSHAKEQNSSTIKKRSRIIGYLDRRRARIADLKHEISIWEQNLERTESEHREIQQQLKKWKTEIGEARLKRSKLVEFNQKLPTQQWTK